jgi:hypothetical protein
MFAYTPAEAIDSLKPGSDAAVCLSMLTPGSLQGCSAATVHRGPVAPGGTDSVPSSVRASEREIDDFLADYGKPPRSAVRALLNPTDENIAAMRAEQTRREVVAAYVAQRLTEIQQAAAGARVPGVPQLYAALPYFMGTRIVAYAPAQCRACDEMYGMLRQFIRDNPVADVQLGLIAEASATAPLDTLLEIGLPLPAFTLSSDQARARGVPPAPVIEINDMRTGRRLFVPSMIEAATLRDSVVGLRREGE